MFKSMMAAVLVAGAAVGTAAAGDTLMPGQAMKPGDKLTSPNGDYTLEYQTDGNLVLYKFQGQRAQKALWDSGTWNKRTGVVVMQNDGNLVIYTDTDQSHTQPIFATNTYKAPGAYLKLQDDGNLVIYPFGKTTDAHWATNTYGK